MSKIVDLMDKKYWSSKERMTMKKQKIYYFTKGNVRGKCGHKHSTESGALRCLVEDQSGCHSQGGYSDRSMYRSSDGARAVLIEMDDGGFYIDEWI